jgi:osmoprotectant transport system substrate-binding protein
LSRTATAHLAASAAAGALALWLVSCGGDHRQALAGVPPPVTATATAPLPGKDTPPVTIGDKNTPEQFVLGELYRQALAAKGFSVSLNRNIGPTEVTIKAMQTGTLDMYPEYVGTWNSAVAGDPGPYSSAKEAYQVARQWAIAHGFDLLAPTPFSNSDAIGVTQSFASQNGLQTISDLGKVQQTLTLGAPPQFQHSQSGLLGIEQAYGVVPASFKPLGIGDQYQALDKGSVQAADVSSTDGQLATGQYKLLQDPKHLFGFNNVAPVVTSKALLAEGPAFAATINTVSALLTTDVMRQLNAAVDISHKDPAGVAKQFLQDNGLVPLASTG